MSNVDFSLINKTKQKVSRRDFLFVLENFLEKMKIDNPIEVNLIIVGKKKIQNLNHIYRKKDKPTDVLSFPIDITSPKDLARIPKSKNIILGDIYICPQMIDEKDFISIQEVFLHGLTHLIGYDHEKDEKEWERVLKKIKL